MGHLPCGVALPWAFGVAFGFAFWSLWFDAIMSVVVISVTDGFNSYLVCEYSVCPISLDPSFRTAQQISHTVRNELLSYDKSPTLDRPVRFNTALTTSTIYSNRSSQLNHEQRWKKLVVYFLRYVIYTEGGRSKSERRAWSRGTLDASSTMPVRGSSRHNRREIFVFPIEAAIDAVEIVVTAHGVCSVHRGARHKRIITHPLHT